MLVEMMLDLEQDYGLPPSDATFRTPGELCDWIARARPGLPRAAAWADVAGRLLAGGAPRERLWPDTPFEVLAE